MNLKILVLSLSVAICLPLSAAHPRQEIAANPYLAAANYLSYPEPTGVTLAKAPKGYKPFHISTYMRHGSRYLIKDGEYGFSYNTLLKADSAGVLTPKGKEVLGKIRRIKEKSKGRLGELTEVGRAQHRGIARRMYSNFPEIFADTTVVNATSTNVIRCIMSMMAECMELKAANPKLNIIHDASEADMHILNNWQYDNARRKPYETSISIESGRQKGALKPDRIFAELFTDPEWVNDNISDKKGWMYMLYYVAGNMQSHSDKSLDFMDLFTTGELYDLWKCTNVEWYCHGANTPASGNRMHFGQTNLYEDIPNDGDASAASRKKGATLRFGHESVVLPTAVFFDLNGAGYSTDDLDRLDDHWVNYRIFPMAANIQFVFYEKPGNDVLVRVLLNEHDATLPLKAVSNYFYRWDDVSEYFRKKLESAKK